jgi:tRNA1(Val) A37 N6-methylase TrmN6
LCTNPDSLFEFQEKDYRREGVQRHLSSWFSNVSTDLGNYYNDKVQYLLKYDLPNEHDILGIIYQSIIHEGKKSHLGSYYTPKEVAENLIIGDIEEDSHVLDPCCGTGQFLLNFSKYISIPENIYGFDIDRNAVEIARTNLLLQYHKIDFKPNVFHLNTLVMNDSSDLFNEKVKFNSYFDIISTNPPWGAKYERNMLKKIGSKFRQINSRESFSFFICQSYKMLKENGEMSFVLPESISNVRTHADIREFILKNTTISNIEILGKKFKNVLSPVITMRMIKVKTRDNEITIKREKKQYSIKQNSFLENRNYLFDIYVDEKTRDIIKKIDSCNSVTLKNNAVWALGIVTGDNKKFLENEKNEKNESIYRGSDVNRLRLSEPSKYIKYSPDAFQQVAKAEKYRAEEKLIYRFISGDLVFAYDNKGSLTLNSANILIPEIKDYHIYLILGFLNSELYNYYFKKKFNTIKILRGDIEQLPFPILNNMDREDLLSCVEKNLQEQESLETLNNVVYDIFKITNEERVHIKTCLRKA